MSLIIRMDSIKTIEHMKTSIPYILNEKKTNGLAYSNAGVTAEQMIKSFLLTKELYPSGGKREAYHFKFSFSKDENISPEDVLAFVKEWAQEYLGDEYDYVLSAHSDREHRHGHLVFNSVRRGGGKYRYEKGDWERVIKPLTNRLAEKYHTGHLKERDAGKDYSADYDRKTDGVTWKEKVQGDIDACIAVSKSYADFKRRMVSQYRYQLREGVSREHGVYLALTPPGKAKAIRSYRLDVGYMPVEIEARIKGAELPERAQNRGVEKTPERQEKEKGLDWLMSRNYTFIPYEKLSDYQKAMVRQTLEAKHLYRRTGTSLQLHEQSVRAVRSMLRQTEGLGIYRKAGKQQAEYLQKHQKQQQKELEKIQKSFGKRR